MPRSTAPRVARGRALLCESPDARACVSIEQLHELASSHPSPERQQRTRKSKPQSAPPPVHAAANHGQPFQRSSERSLEHLRPRRPESFCPSRTYADHRIELCDPLPHSCRNKDRHPADTTAQNPFRTSAFPGHDEARHRPNPPRRPSHSPAFKRKCFALHVSTDNVPPFKLIRVMRAPSPDMQREWRTRKSADRPARFCPFAHRGSVTRFLPHKSGELPTPLLLKRLRIRVASPGPTAA